MLCCSSVREGLVLDAVHLWLKKLIVRESLLHISVR